MKKKMFVVVTIVVLAAMSYTVLLKSVPVTFGSSAVVLHYSMSDMIKGSELIIIGEVATNLPSQWMDANGKGSRSASPADIAQAHGLFTDSVISITQTLKGDILKPSVRIRNFSGEIENIRWVNESEPSLVIGKTYLFFLRKDIGATAKVEPGDYLSIGAYQGVYEIVDGKAISMNDEWDLEELIAYIEKALSADALSPTLTITPINLLTETLTALPLPTETPSPTVTSTEMPTETPTEIPSETPTP